MDFHYRLQENRNMVEINNRGGLSALCACVHVCLRYSGKFWMNNANLTTLETVRSMICQDGLLLYLSSLCLKARSDSRGKTAAFLFMTSKCNTLHISVYYNRELSEYVQETFSCHLFTC